MAERPSDDFTFGHFSARRFAQPWRGPSRSWRLTAICCTAAGTVLAWLIVGDSDAVVVRTIFGGVIGLVVGMIVVETIWERRRAATRPDSPIGPRR